jgi:diguanylate cyclase (GGDEF)-like protein
MSRDTDVLGGPTPAPVGDPRAPEGRPPAVVHPTWRGKWVIFVLAAVATGAVAAVQAMDGGNWLSVLPAIVVLWAGVWGLRGDPPAGPDTTDLERAEDLLRGVFTVSTELVGCVDEADAQARFATAMRRWWAADSIELWIWERGSWRPIGESAGAPPELSVPVQLPARPGDDLILDLSSGVQGQAALVLRGAREQPTLLGLAPELRQDVAELLRGQLALGLRRVVRYAALQQLARRDGLTGTWRRWYGEARLAELVEAGEAVGLCMVDIDHFKLVNDRHGHAAGDRVLTAVGACLAEHLRTGDLVCRFGGEEFLCILPGTDPPGTAHVAGRLREAVAALTGLPVRVTVSVGAATCRTDDTPATLVARADVSMYRAKQLGRDRVELAEDEPGTTRMIRKGSGVRQAIRPESGMTRRERPA